MVLPSLISSLKKQRQTDLCEFEASLVYRVSSRTGSKATQRNLVLKIKKQSVLDCNELSRQEMAKMDSHL